MGLVAVVAAYAADCNSSNGGPDAGSAGTAGSAGGAAGTGGDAALDGCAADVDAGPTCAAAACRLATCGAQYPPLCTEPVGYRSCEAGCLDAASCTDLSAIAAAWKNRTDVWVELGLVECLSACLANEPQFECDPADAAAGYSVPAWWVCDGVGDCVLSYPPRDEEGCSDAGTGGGGGTGSAHVFANCSNAAQDCDGCDCVWLSGGGYGGTCATQCGAPPTRPKL